MTILAGIALALSMIGTHGAISESVTSPGRAQSAIRMHNLLPRLAAVSGAPAHRRGRLRATRVDPLIALQDE